MNENPAVTSKHESAPNGSRRRILRRLCAIGFGFALALGVAEIGLRLAGIGMPSLYAPDHYCGSRLRASTSGVWTREGHGNIVINAQGFRGPELSDEKASDRFRVAVLGDSFIEALQVDVQDSFCVQLQNLLNADEQIPDRQYEVINCGVSGYGTAQELQMLRHHVLQLQPDAVLLAVYPENDIRNNVRELEQDPARPYFTVHEDGSLIRDDSFRQSAPYVAAQSAWEQRKAAIVNRSRVLQLLQHAKQNLFQGTGNEQASPVPAADEALSAETANAVYVYAEPADPSHQQAWRITERLMQELAAECERQQIPLFAFTVSSPVQVYPDAGVRDRVAARHAIDDLFYSERRIETIFAETQVSFCPLASKLQEVADSSGEFLHGFPNSRTGFGHWNELGHQTASRIVASWLVQEESFRRGQRVD